MKKLLYQTSMMLAAATIMISCSKQEPTVDIPEKKMEIWNDQYDPPYAFMNYLAANNPDSYKAGVDAPGASFGSQYLGWTIGPAIPYKTIKNPTAEYLHETCALDITKLTDDKTYHLLQSGTLTLGFFDFGTPHYDNYDFKPIRLLKLKTTIEALEPASERKFVWWSTWGAAGVSTQRDQDDILYAQGGFSIRLSKPVTEFGFEVSGNKKYDMTTIEALIGNNDDEFDSVGVSRRLPVVVETTMPGGARLIGIKASKPFALIRITPPNGVADGGFALANIRYKLSKVPVLNSEP
jgi:hypothetical protein